MNKIACFLLIMYGFTLSLLAQNDKKESSLYEKNGNNDSEPFVKQLKKDILNKNWSSLIKKCDKGYVRSCQINADLSSEEIVLSLLRKENDISFKRKKEEQYSVSGMEFNQIQLHEDKLELTGHFSYKDHHIRPFIIHLCKTDNNWVICY